MTRRRRSGNLTGVTLREELGLLDSSYGSFIEDFTAWHHDPAYPDRRARTLLNDGLRADVAAFAARVGPKYWGAYSTQAMRSDAPQWPAEMHHIIDCLCRFAAYKGSFCKRRKRPSPRVPAKAKTNCHHLRTLVSSSSGPPGEVSKRLELIAEEISKTSKSDSAPGSTEGLQATSIEELEKIAVHVLQTISTQKHQKMATQGLQTTTQGLHTVPTQGSWSIAPGAITTPVQANLAMTPRQVSAPVLLVSVSTKPGLRAVPFSLCVDPKTTKSVILTAWSDYLVDHRVETITISYPWLSSRKTELVLKDWRDFMIMQGQVETCPAWRYGHVGYCPEVEIIIEKEQKEVLAETENEVTAE